MFQKMTGETLVLIIGIIFDWNDPAVEFNVQFVGPKKEIL